MKNVLIFLITATSFLFLTAFSTPTVTACPYSKKKVHKECPHAKKHKAHKECPHSKSKKIEKECPHKGKKGCNCTKGEKCSCDNCPHKKAEKECPHKKSGDCKCEKCSGEKLIKTKCDSEISEEYGYCSYEG